MQSLNDGLNKDKLELNKIIHHLKNEKNTLNAEKFDLEI